MKISTRHETPAAHRPFKRLSSLLVVPLMASTFSLLLSLPLLGAAATSTAMTHQPPRSVVQAQPKQPAIAGQQVGGIQPSGIRIARPIPQQRRLEDKRPITQRIPPVRKSLHNISAAKISIRDPAKLALPHSTAIGARKQLRERKPIALGQKTHLPKTLRGWTKHIKSLGFKEAIKSPKTLEKGVIYRGVKTPFGLVDYRIMNDPSRAPPRVVAVKHTNDIRANNYVNLDGSAIGPGKGQAFRSLQKSLSHFRFEK